MQNRFNTNKIILNFSLFYKLWYVKNASIFSIKLLLIWYEHIFSSASFKILNTAIPYMYNVHNIC